MKKCYSCSKKFPDQAMRKMVNVIGRKAYPASICPACLSVVINNPNYYDLMEEEVTPAKKK